MRAWAPAFRIICLLFAFIFPALGHSSENSPDSVIDHNYFDLSYLSFVGKFDLNSIVLPGKNVFEAQVTYGRTGALHDEVREKPFLGVNFFPHEPFPAGTHVFAVPFGSQVGIFDTSKFMWCTIEGQQGPISEAQHFNTWCFFKRAFNTDHVASFGPDAFPAYAQPSNDTLATSPVVDEQPENFSPPLMLSLQFAGWDGGKANFRLLLRQRGQLHPFGTTVLPNYLLSRPHLQADTDGIFHLRLLGGEMVIKKDAQGQAATIEVVKPFDVHKVEASGR